MKRGALKQSSHQLVRVPCHRVGSESQENILIFFAAKIIVIVIVDNLRIQLNTAGNLLQRGSSVSRKKCGIWGRGISLNPLFTQPKITFPMLRPYIT